MSGSEDRLDRRFVVTAALLAAVYALLVAIIAATLGKEAAGAAGVGLSALGTAIFARFANLRFTVTTQDSSAVEIPRIKVWVVMLAGLVCFVTSAGLMILIMLIGLLVW